jgi:hydroxymethylpyrimidine/phosphomethylpyrimidine kinase
MSARSRSHGGNAVASAIAAALAVRPWLLLVVDPVLAARCPVVRRLCVDARRLRLVASERSSRPTRWRPRRALARVDDPLLAELLARARAVLLKGGHLPGDPTDFLFQREGVERFSAPRIPATARGTGCRLASAIAAGLARDLSLREAVSRARQLVRDYLHAHLSV